MADDPKKRIVDAMMRHAQNVANLSRLVDEHTRNMDKLSSMMLPHMPLNTLIVTCLVMVIRFYVIGRIGALSPDGKDLPPAADADVSYSKENFLHHCNQMYDFYLSAQTAYNDGIRAERNKASNQQGPTT